MEARSTFDTAAEYGRLQAARARLRALAQGEFGAQLETVLSRPEFLPFLTEFDVRVDSREMHLRMDGDACVHVAPELVAAPEAFALRLRHALERHAWREAARAVACPDGDWIASVLALHACLAYLQILPESDHCAAVAALPRALGAAYEGFLAFERGAGTDEEQVQWLATHRDALGPESSDCSDADAAVAIAKAGLMLARPVEELLTRGGDKRLHLAPETGLNKYGCSPKPRPWAATFSTCTASSISAPGYRAAEHARRGMFRSVLQGRLEQEWQAQTRFLRRTLMETLHLDRVDGADVVLTASGTDAELIAVYCATDGRPRNVTNIVISPKEVGSGTVRAAGGRHFDPSPPLGENVLPGTPIEGLAADQIEVVPLEVRDEHGRVRDLRDLDRTLHQQVEAAVRAGNFVIVHLLDCSKTGFGGPTFDALCELKTRHPNSLAVIVDAAQMRVSRRMLQRYLAHGFLIIATGSKFFTGPPFSGALFVPAELAPTGAQCLPPGLAEYCARSDFPDTWSQVVHALPHAANLGLMMRWFAALWEMRAFFSVDAAERRAIFDTFAERMHGHLRDVAAVAPLPAEVYPRSYEHDDDDWDQIQTIFSFYVRRRDVDGVVRYLGYEEAGRVYHWLNSDISALLPAGASDHERQLARHCCHIGQPVRIQNQDGEWCAALRIAVGARLVSRVAHDPALGRERAQRLAQQEQSARRVLDKITLICTYWPELVTLEAGQQAPDPNFSPLSSVT